MSKLKFLIFLLILFIFKNSIAFSQENICDPSDNLDKLIEKVYLYDENNPQPAIECSLMLIDKHDHVDGYGWLGWFYFHGYGLELDYEKAIENLILASDRGDGWSSDFLNNIYAKGIYGDGKIYVKQDRKKAFDYAELAYDQNYFDPVDIADAYYYGLGVEVDHDKSFELLNRYQDSIEEYGLFLLANHYFLGRGTTQDIPKGIKIYQELIDNGYDVLEDDFNILFGTEYKDVENRTVKSIFFERMEKEKKANFSYYGLDQQNELHQIIEDGKYLEAADYAQDIIENYIITNFEITYEVCYALAQYSYLVTNFDIFPEKEKQKIDQYNEIAYQKNCGDTSGFNIANSIIWEDEVSEEDYQKAYEICISSIESYADDQCVSLIGYIIEKGFISESDNFNAYILYKWRSENMHETLDPDFEWLDERLSEVEEKISRDEILIAQNIVNDINTDFNKIYEYLFLSNKSKYNDTIEVQQSNELDPSNDLVPSYQKEIILTRSSSELQKNLTVNDTFPPDIFVNEDIQVQGFVANLVINIKDDSKIEAVFIDDTPVVIDYNNLGKILINQSVFIGDKDKTITITAYDKWGLSGVKTVSLKKSIESFNINYGKYYALIIGNNNYEYLPKLKTAVNDAEVFSQVLENKYNFEKVITLTNASRKEILTELYNLKNTLSFNDNLLIYYAGHGQIDRQLDIGYWQPVDALPDLPTEWIGIDTITSIISTMKSKHILVVADSCYSGLLTRSSNSFVNDSFATRELYLQRMNDKKSRIAFTSGGEEPVPDGGGGNHSIFAKHLIDFLKENNREITISEISSRITQQVITNSEQTPELAPMHKSGHDGGEFIFVPSI